MKHQESRAEDIHVRALKLRNDDWCMEHACKTCKSYHVPTWLSLQKKFYLEEFISPIQRFQTTSK